MFERFFPDTTVSSTYAIDYEKLYEEGYRGILFVLTIRLSNMEKRQRSRQNDCFPV